MLKGLTVLERASNLRDAALLTGAYMATAVLYKGKTKQLGNGVNP